MTTPGRYASSDGSFARSTGNAAARGMMLIAVAVLIGVVLLAKGFDNPSGPEAVQASPTTTDASSETTDTQPTDETTTTIEGGTESTETIPVTPPSARPAGEVKVVVANGTGTRGAAGAAKDNLTAVGFVAEARNAVTVPTELSAVYYVTGYSEEAKEVASTLGGTASLLREAPNDPLALIKSSDGLDEFHVFVILGSDGAIS